MAVETIEPISDAPRSYVIPERTRLHGPLVATRLRRTAIGFGLVWLLALVPIVVDAAPGWKAFGLGLLLPGAGFLYTSDPVFVLITLVLFVVAFVAWFGSGNIVAPPLVWVGAAALSVLRVDDGRWTWAEWFVPALLAAIIVLGMIGQRVAFGAAKRRAHERNRYLAKLGDSPGVDAAASRAVTELSAEDLATARFALDLALQPVEEFEGYDFIDQFQTSAVRYQLNFQQYALALMQLTRVPAFTGYLAQAQRNLITKMTDRRVWGFWRWENLLGNLDPNPDPIRKDNIMVSGYLGVMVGAYESNTGDRRFDAPGSLTFRWNDRKEFAYDFHSIAEAVHRNFVRSPFGMFPCEPNWIYAACNTFGMNTLLLHDRLHGTEYAPEVAEKYRHSIDVEFLTADGRITAIRSSRLGLTIPMLTSTMADAGMVVFLNPSMPDIALRTWTLVRTELIDLRADGATIELRGWDKIDVGNYRRSEVSPHAILMGAAREMGDDEVFDALQASVDAHFEPVVADGTRRYAKASTQANAMLLLGRCSRRNGFRDLIVARPDPVASTGPVLASAPYPDVLVARAVSDGRSLDLVLRPGGTGGRSPLVVERLAPGATYRLTGCVAEQVDADANGTARLDVDLGDRLEVRISPVA